MLVLKVKVISLPYIFQVLYVLCFTRPRYQVSVYRTIGPLVVISSIMETSPYKSNPNFAFKHIVKGGTWCWYLMDKKYVLVYIIITSARRFK